MFNPMVWRLIWQAAGETLYMVGVAVVLAEVVGLPLGIILVTTERGHILENPWLTECWPRLSISGGRYRLSS